ncbi:MAG TPA: hypothetical protein VKC89_02580 [Patescibacteria group bacterium]|nr:hypothetical protein [Patescibacteria group bacterium]
MTLTLNLKTTRILTLILFSLILSFVCLIFVSHTFAQTDSPKTRAERMEIVKQKRDAQKIKVCQIHERNIQNRLSHLSDLVKNTMLKFDAIVTRTKTRYTEKLLPAGKTVPNYDSLLADITAKRAAVDVALVSASSNANNFSCDTSLDPKGDITKYRESMQAVKNALHDYRKSIRNLIVAVAQAGGEKIPSPTPNEK